MLVFATASVTSAIIGVGTLVYLRLWQSPAPAPRSRPQSNDQERSRPSATQPRAKAISPFQANLTQKQSSGDGTSLRNRDRLDVSSAHSEHHSERQRAGTQRSQTLMPASRGRAGAFLAEEPDEYSGGGTASVRHPGPGRSQRTPAQAADQQRPLPQAVLEAQAKTAAAKSLARGEQRPLPRAVLEAQQKKQQQTKSKRSSASSGLPELPSRTSSPGQFYPVSSLQLQHLMTPITSKIRTLEPPRWSALPQGAAPYDTTEV